MELSEIQNKIEALEIELANYQKEQEQRINEIMFRTGLLEYISKVNVDIAKYQGQITALKSLLPETPPLEENG